MVSGAFYALRRRCGAACLNPPAADGRLSAMLWGFFGHQFTAPVRSALPVLLLGLSYYKTNGTPDAWD